MNQLISNVLMQPKPDAVERPMTLIEKLKHEHDDRELTCQDLFEDGHFDDKKTELLIQQTGVMAGLQIAIDMIKQHSDWISVDERLPHAEEMLTNHYEPKEFYEIILKTGELLIASYTHMKNDGINEILFMDCTIVLTDGHWELLDAGFDGYQKDEVAYWKPIQPPSEVQA